MEFSKNFSAKNCSGIRENFDVYTAFIRNSFLKMLAYRLRYYTGILTYLLFVSVHYFIWSAIFVGSGNAGASDSLVHGYRLSEMVTYVAIGWIARSFYFSNVDEEIDSLVRTGQISVYLLRPVNFQIMMLSQAMGESLFRLIFFSVPIGLVVFLIFPIMGPSGLLNFLLFCMSTVIGFFVLVGINFLIGLVAFSFKSIDGVIRSKYFVVQLFSGLLLPLSFFPKQFQTVLDLLPFKVIAYIPLQFYLGKVSQGELFGIFFNQIFWVLVLTYAGKFFWKRALAKLTLQGG